MSDSLNQSGATVIWVFNPKMRHDVLGRPAMLALVVVIRLYSALGATITKPDRIDSPADIAITLPPFPRIRQHQRTLARVTIY
jgi:hypothetical protein